MSQFHAVPRSKVYMLIVDQILDKIRSGVFPAGSSLPPERLLAEQLGVSRGSLREAIRVLEHTNVLDVRGGSGTYITDDSRTKATMLRAQAAVVGEHSPLDVIVARRAVEPVCADLAARFRRPRNLTLLREALNEQALLTQQGEDPAEADFAFHLAVATASQNEVLLTLEQNLISLMHQGTWSELKQRSRSRAHGAERYLEHHEAILQAIEAGDSTRAARATVAHLDAIESGLLAELGGG